MVFYLSDEIMEYLNKEMSNVVLSLRWSKRSQRQNETF